MLDVPLKNTNLYSNFECAHSAGLWLGKTAQPIFLSMQCPERTLM